MQIILLIFIPLSPIYQFIVIIIKSIFHETFKLLILNLNLLNDYINTILK